MNSKYNPFSIAVIDLFASALGAFMVLAFISFPFITNTSKANEYRINKFNGQIKSLKEQVSAMEVQLEKSKSDEQARKKQFKNAEHLTGQYRLDSVCSPSDSETIGVINFIGYKSGLVKKTSTSMLNGKRIISRSTGFLQSNGTLILNPNYDLVKEAAVRNDYYYYGFVGYVKGHQIGTCQPVLHQFFKN